MEEKSQHPPIKYGKTGVLIINLGTPDSTSWFDIRKYLKEFLSDNRVIEVNPIVWQIILNLFILNFRPSKTAKAYKEIWMKEENVSPLLYYTKKQANKLSNFITTEKTVIDFAMRYGNPSIKSKITKLKDMGCENLIILPLYPQYAAATTATVCDEVYRTLMKMRWQPSLKIIPHYESDPLYINALVNSMSMKDLKQYVENDMADFLYNCSESELINEFLIKVEHTTDQQFYNKFVKQIKW